MSARYFLDTNILLYTFDERYPAKRAIAKRLIRDGLERRDAFISYQVIQEFYNAMFKRFLPLKPLKMPSIISQMFFAPCWKLNHRRLCSIGRF